MRVMMRRRVSAALTSSCSSRSSSACRLPGRHSSYRPCTAIEHAPTSTLIPATHTHTHTARHRAQYDPAPRPASQRSTAAAITTTTTTVAAPHTKLFVAKHHCNMLSAPYLRLLSIYATIREQ